MYGNEQDRSETVQKLCQTHIMIQEKDELRKLQGSKLIQSNFSLVAREIEKANQCMVFGTPCLTHNDFKWQMPEFEAIKEGITGAFFKRDDISSLSESIDGWFEEHALQREQVRVACMKEIDTQWTPQFQVEVIKTVLNQ